LAEVSLNTWSPTSDPTRIPEVRHNVRLIADACKSDLDGLAREAKSLQERKKFVIAEDARLRKRVEEEAERECYVQCLMHGALRLILFHSSDFASTANSTGGQ
jgi:hypothetical protein